MQLSAISCINNKNLIFNILCILCILARRFPPSTVQLQRKAENWFPVFSICAICTICEKYAKKGKMQKICRKYA